MSATSGTRIAIIGAGVSGLVSIKSCLEEGLLPTAFEQFEYLGGLWHFLEEPRHGQGASVYESLVLNTSIHMTAFSDFPFQGNHLPHYVTHDEALRYLHAYADEFKLWGHIKFRCEVIQIRPSSDYDVTGKWTVQYENKMTGTECTEVYDAVIFCCGRYKKPFIPQIPGMETFKGSILHAHDYRRKRVFHGKTVLVVGNANSSADIASDASEEAEKAYLTVGDGAWVHPRFSSGSIIPMDYALRRIIYSLLPTWLFNRLVRQRCSRELDHASCGLVTEATPIPIDASTMVNDRIGNKIKTGAVTIKGNLESLSEDGATFKDGGDISGLDMVCLATGYGPEYAFVSEDILPDFFNKLLLYKVILPTHLKHATLGLIGAVGVRGPVFPLYELQSRWLSAVFSGHIRPPSRAEMEKEYLCLREAMTKRFGFLKFIANPISYQDDLARDLRIIPSFWTLLFTRPWDLMIWYFRPAFPALFRLYGRHRWAGARAELQKAWEARLDPRNARLE